MDTVALKRLAVTLSEATFFWGWNRMMWILGAKRQPRTTEPLRLTEIHMVVVCTWGGGGRGGRDGGGEVMNMSVWIAFFILFYYSIFLSFADGYLEKVWPHGGSSG